MGFLGVVLLVLGIPAAGKLALDVLGASMRSHALDFGAAIATGFCLVMLALYAPLVIVGKVVFWPALVILGAGLVHAARAGVRRRWFAKLDVPAVVLALAIFGLWCAIARHAPWWGYDGKAIYGFKAKVLLHERDLAGPAFQDVDVVHYHADYPLGMPLLIALSAWVAEGTPVDPAGRTPAPGALAWVERHDAVNAYGYVAGLWGLGLLALLYHLARERFGTGRAPFVATFLAMPVALAFPWIAGRSWSWEGADVPLALCLGIAGLAALRALDAPARPERRMLVPAALAAGGALFLKNDAVLALASLSLVLVFGVRGRERLGSITAIVVGGGLAWLCITAVRNTTPGSPFDERYGAALLALDPLAALGRLPQLLRDTWIVLHSKSMLAYWLFVLLVGLPLALRAGGRARLLGAWVLLHVVLCGGVFLITPNDMTWHITTALPRLWCHLGVPAGWLVIGACDALWRGTRVRDLLPRPVPA